MLWFRLCILVILISNDVFGTLLKSGKSRYKPNTRRTRISTTEEPELQNESWNAISTEQDKVTDDKNTTDVPTPSEPDTSTSEVPTTTIGLHTTDIETTQSPPTTSVKPTRECNTSLLTKEDLQLIFRFFEKDQLIKEGIIERFHKDAESVADKHLKVVVALNKMFRDKPVHLKHILQEVSDARIRLMPSLKDISNTLNEYPDLLKQFEDKNETLTKIIHNFQSKKRLCELICEPKDLVGRTLILKDPVPYNEDEFYCGSIEDVRGEIQRHLSNFTNNQKVYYQDNLQLQDEIYAAEIEQLKIKLKNIALEVFGQTMYDILQLQDDYVHFSEEMKDGNIKVSFDKIKQNLAEIKPKMVALEIAIPKLAKYCSKCNDNLRLVSRQFHNKVSSTKIRFEVSRERNLLSEVIDTELKRIKEEIDNNYTALFDDLRQAIEETNSTNTYINDIKPIQNELIEEIKEETAELNKINLMISEENYKGMISLGKHLKSILTILDEDISFIENYIK